MGYIGNKPTDQAIEVGADQVVSSTIADGSIVNADLNSNASIDATKLADGSVTSTELQYINTLTSNAQTQFDAKASLSGATFTGNLTVQKSFPDIFCRADNEGRIGFMDNGGAIESGFKNNDGALNFYAGGTTTRFSITSSLVSSTINFSSAGFVKGTYFTHPTTNSTTVIKGNNTGIDVDIQTSSGDSIAYFEASNKRLGIGTTNPSQPLHIKVNNQNSDPHLFIENAHATGRSHVRFWNSSRNTYWTLGQDNDNNFKLSNTVHFGTGNNNIKWDMTSGGILTTRTEGSHYPLNIYSYGNSARIGITATKGTQASPTDIDEDEFLLGGLDFYGWESSSNRRGASILGYTAGVWSSTSYPTDLTFWTVPASSTTPVERMRIASDGNATFTGHVTVTDNSLKVKRDNDWTGSPMIAVEQDGTGDAFMKWILTGGATYALGIDNSDSDYFKLGYHATSPNEAVNTNTLLTITNSGNATFAGHLITGADKGLWFASNYRTGYQGNESTDTLTLVTDNVARLTVNNNGTTLNKNVLWFLGTSYNAKISQDGQDGLNFDVGNNGTELTLELGQNNNVIVPNGNLKVTNDNKSIYLGASDDLRIIHDGNHSYIDHENTGDLRIRSRRHNGDIQFYNEDSSGNEQLTLQLTGAGNANFGGDVTINSPSGDTGWGLTVTNSYSSSSDVSITMAYANSSNRNSGIGVSMDDTNSGEYLLNLASGGTDRFRVRGDGLAYFTGMVQAKRGFTAGQALDIEGNTFGRTNSSDVAFGYRQDGSGNLMLLEGNSGADRFTVTQAGNVTIAGSLTTGASLYVNSSDFTLDGSNYKSEIVLHTDDGGTMRAGLWMRGGSVSNSVHQTNCFLRTFRHADYKPFSDASDYDTALWTSTSSANYGALWFGTSNGSNGTTQAMSIDTSQHIHVWNGNMYFEGDHGTYYGQSNSSGYHFIGNNPHTHDLMIESGGDDIDIVGSWIRIRQSASGGVTSSFHTQGHLNVGGDAQTTWAAKFDGIGGSDIFVGDNASVNSLTERSDIRLKKYINNIPYGEDFINKLRPVEFQWKTDATKGGARAINTDAKQFGLIAQEVKELIDEESLDWGAYRNRKSDDDEEIVELQYTQFIAPLIKAVQELSAKVKALENA